MEFTGYTFTLKDWQTWRDILLAYLSELPFESFTELDNGNLIAYIATAQDDEKEVETIIQSIGTHVDYTREPIAKVNWNAEWEKQFDPIIIGDKCIIRAEFHEKNPDVAMDIVIQPKMSFGTGHHETTQLIMEYLLDERFDGLDVLDMGCGTGVLGICAKMRGANFVEAIDIDEWAYENSIENAERNQTKLSVKCGGAELLGNTSFDWVIANINKNILIRDIPAYVSVLKTKGTLILSGLLHTDFDDIKTVCTQNGLKFENKKQLNEWIALRLTKV